MVSVNSRKFQFAKYWGLFLLLFGLCMKQYYCECTIDEHADDVDTKKHENELLRKIKPLNGLTFSLSDDEYDYKLAICGAVSGQAKGIGAIQVPKGKASPVKVLGRFDQADIMGGTNWVLLYYLNGTVYEHHCNGSKRITQIMIICDPKLEKGKLHLLEEKRRNISSQCSYWFELSSNVVCDSTMMTTNPVTPEQPHKLSSGSVFCIIFFTVLGAYLLVGTLYKRIVVGSKGVEQIPNYEFWRTFGNLQADACDYVCRCRGAQDSHAYRGIDERLRSDEPDDQLLNM